MLTTIRPLAVTLTVILSGAIGVLASDTVSPSLLSALEWRLVGPYRGGRVTSVAGVPNHPQLYYLGATGGGVWKTENSGLSWENISDDHFNVGTIGAIAVADSDPNVIYVGTGEKSIRGVTTSRGDGLYKSTDAGDTWEQVLSVDSQTGATDLRMDPTNPRILYAAMWEHGRTPWCILSGGTAGGIFKSTDGGESWKKLQNGLPELIGKIGVDVSASNPKRLYAIIEAMPGEGGLYRSDDGGDSWELNNESRILWTRSWYYMHIAADPVDENVVYVMNAPFMKSIDGGVTFEKRTTPHGDHHPSISVIVLTNSDRGVEAYTAVADAMVSAFTKLEPHTAVANGVDPSVLDPFVGVFKGTFQDLEITTNGGRYQFVQNSKLTKPGANPAPANLANTTEGWFIVTEGPNKGELGELLEDLSGERNYLRFSHRIFIRSTEEDD